MRRNLLALALFDRVETRANIRSELAMAHWLFKSRHLNLKAAFCAVMSMA